MKHATPRFPGHEQPKVPLWGYEDESDLEVMEKKISAALEHGIDGFLWDMYSFEDGGYRFNALDKGFFGAKIIRTLKYPSCGATMTRFMHIPQPAGVRMIRFLTEF